MEHARSFVNETGNSEPFEILQHAYFQTNSLGTCTACLVAIDHNELSAANLGDSGFIVLRRLPNASAKEWGLYFQTTEQVHFFNCPFQLGTNSKDSPSDAQSFKIPVEQGDIIVLATDGLFDNLFVHDIIDVR